MHLQIWMHFLCGLYLWHHTSPRKKSNLSTLVTVVCEKTLGRRIYSGKLIFCMEYPKEVAKLVLGIDVYHVSMIEN